MGSSVLAWPGRARLTKGAPSVLKRAKAKFQRISCERVVRNEAAGHLFDKISYERTWVVVRSQSWACM